MNFLNAGPNLEITALGDLYPHRLESCRATLLERHGAEVPDQNCFTGFDSYKKVIDSGVDIVLLCEPPFFRSKSFEYAVQSRKHAFIEKPVGVDPVGSPFCHGCGQDGRIGRPYGCCRNTLQAHA
jgi:myo-inositol 2-dehydrogenase / D-chiro-inositol 1-dehydrogenase